MLAGSVIKMLVFGVVLCGIFGVSTYAEGWMAYGVGAVFALLVTVIAAIISFRSETQIGRASCRERV